MAYEHTQAKSTLTAVLLVAAVAFLIWAVVVAEPAMLLTPAVLVLVAVVIHAMSSLTTVVTDETITVRFRWGRPRRVIPRSQVVRAEVVRNRWWYGWGVRVIPRATLYNVWGLDAVHLELKGRRDIRIGTDDPEGLAAAIGDEPSSDRRSARRRRR